MSRFEREEMLIGREGVLKLKNSTVALFGLGGVGSYICEALARAGVGHLILVDNDTVSESNINRQLVALTSTVGKLKTEVAAKRVKDINPDMEVTVYNCFYLPENADSVDISRCDYIADAVDTVSAKIELAVRGEKLGIPVISCMGTGNRIDYGGFTVTDIYKTDTCHLARVMRRELRKRGVKKLKVVFSASEAMTVAGNSDVKPVPGSISYVPPIAGLMCAGEIIRDLLNDKPMP